MECSNVANDPPLSVLRMCQQNFRSVLPNPTSRRLELFNNTSSTSRVLETMIKYRYVQPTRGETSKVAPFPRLANPSKGTSSG